MASLSLSPQERAAVEAFRRDVLEVSRQKLVLVRFTATWCGPCKQLAPVIEKVVADYKDRVVQVPVDIDENPLLAEQFRIQSVPTVYVFLNGQPVDGFVGVRPESEIRALIDKHLASLPPTAEEVDIEAHVAEGNALLAEGNAAAAAEMFATLAKEFPERADIAASYARALIALGQTEGAAAALAPIPDDNHEPVVVQARAALELAKNARPASELDALKAKVEASPDDQDARMAYADALFANGQREEGADMLFACIAADPARNDGEARKKLLKYIESIGLSDPWSVEQRRRLSSILFT